MSNSIYKQQINIFDLANVPVITEKDPIEVLELPLRLENALKNYDILTVGQFYRLKRAEMLTMRNIGSKALSFFMDLQTKIEMLCKFPKEIESKKNSNLLPQSEFMENTLNDAFENFLQESLEVLELPTKLENALKLNGCTTVGQFYGAPDYQFMEIKNIGYKSIKYFDEIKKRIREQPRILTENKPLMSNKPLMLTVKEIEDPVLQDYELITSLFQRCGTERAKDIIIRRYGLITGERQTLEEIGDFYGITRERIRQIQAKSLRKIRHHMTKARKPLIELVEKIFYENGGILTDEEADIKIPQMLGQSTEDGSSILDLLSDVGWIQSCKIGDFEIYSSVLNGISLCKLSENIIELIKKKSAGVNISTILEQIPDFMGIKDLRFNPKMFIFRYCRIDPRIEELKIEFGQLSTSKNHDSIIFYHPHAKNHFSVKIWMMLITKVLDMEQMPLHFTDIANRVNDLIGNSERQLDTRRAHSILIENNDFAHSGVRGTYGLTSWGLRKETTSQLIEECLRKAGFPLHWKQIFNYVSKYKDTKPINITAILNSQNKYISEGKGVFGLRS